MIKTGVSTFTQDGPTLEHLIKDKLLANVRLGKLHRYYKGNHDILQRWYPEHLAKPNNRIVVNYCKLVVDFLSAYLVGVPVEYVGASSQLTQLLEANYDSEVMMGAVTDVNIFGFGVELYYVDEEGELHYDSVSPLESILVLDDSLQQKFLAYLRLVPKDAAEKDGYILYVYTADTISTYNADAHGSTQLINRVPNTLGCIPVVAYFNDNDKQGSFEQLIPLQDALNKIYSDSVNDFEEFVDSFLILEGMEATQPEDIIRMKQDRVMLIPPDSKAYWLVKQVNHHHIKQLQDDISRELMRMGYIPDVTDITGFNVSGESMKLRLIFTEIRASNQESFIRKGLQRKVEILQRYLNYFEPSAINSIQLKFTRNFMLSLVGEEEKVAKEGEGEKVVKEGEVT